jgi:hypothetical protein
MEARDVTVASESIDLISTLRAALAWPRETLIDLVLTVVTVIAISTGTGVSILELVARCSILAGVRLAANDLVLTVDSFII